MTIDVYQMCPCGSGKKIKFCCCRDITSDLSKVVQKLDAEQRVAALEQVSKTIAKRGNRPALLAIKAIAQLQLGNEEGAEETVAAFLAEDPRNSVALALSATVKSAGSDPVSGVEPLQRALQNVGDEIPAAVYESIGALAEALLVAGHVMAARAHYLLQAGMSDSKDEEVNEILSRLTRSPQLPLLLKQTLHWDECPADSPLKVEFDQALDLASSGTWLAAAEKLAELAQRAPDQASLHRNLGLLYCCLARTDEAVAALHRYAAHDGEVDLEDRVEAEALAQLLDGVSLEDKVSLVAVKYPVPDVDKLTEQLSDNPRFDRIPVDPAKLGGEDSPPPKVVYYLLDRPLPATGAEIDRADIPTVLSELFLFGRETDREARLEAVLAQTEDFDEKKKALIDVLGELLEEPTETETVGEISATEAALSWNWRMPNDVPADRREQLVADQRREMILEKWPNTRLPAVDGKTPLETKDDPACRVPLLAAIWLLEMSGDMQLWQLDYNELRAKLGLPPAEAIDPTDLDVMLLPLTRISRLAADKLTDEQLAIVFQRAHVHQINGATRTLAKELLNRESLADAVNRPNLYAALVRTAPDTKTGLEMVHQAQQAARERKESPAFFLIAEMSLRIRRGEISEFQGLVSELEAKHMQEPGVAQAVTSLMVQYGLISPEDVNAARRTQAMQSGPLGRRARQAGAGPPVLPGTGGIPGMPASVPAADAAAAVDDAAAAGGGLWTPDGDATPQQPTGEKPKIWTPGMD
jgi:hypothetical protein